MKAEANSSAEQRKQPYATPRLTVYGSIEDITEGAPGSPTDGGSPAGSK